MAMAARQNGQPLTLRHLGFSISEAGLKCLASFYVVIVVAPLLVALLWWLLAVAMD